MKKKKSRVEYHPGFVGGLEFMLWQYNEELIFDDEHTLSKKPLEVDMIVVKKRRDLVIEKDIARLFKEHNIIEYKSPKDSLNIDDLFKTLCYACLYKSLGRTVNEIETEEVTVSVFRHNYPTKLFRHLKKLGVGIKEEYPGIYYVTGLVFFPLQIVVMKQLEKEENAAIKILTPDAEEEDVEAFVSQIGMHKEQGYTANADAVLQVSVSVNKMLYEKINGRSETMCEALRDLFKDDLEKAEKSGFSKGKLEGRLEGRLEGKLEGKLELVRIVIKNENITSEEAFDRLYLSKEEREAVRKLL